MDADVEISKPGESSFGAAAKDVKITTTIDTLVKGMLIFHHDGEAGISMWVPPDAQDPCGTVNILKTLLETVKQSKTGLLALDNHDTEMVGEELLKMKKLGLGEWDVPGGQWIAALPSKNKLIEIRAQPGGKETQAFKD